MTSGVVWPWLWPILGVFAIVCTFVRIDVRLGDVFAFLRRTIAVVYVWLVRVFEGIACVVFCTLPGVHVGACRRRRTAVPSVDVETLLARDPVLALSADDGGLTDDDWAWLAAVGWTHAVDRERRRFATPTVPTSDDQVREWQRTHETGDPFPWEKLRADGAVVGRARYCDVAVGDAGSHDD